MKIVRFVYPDWATRTSTLVSRRAKKSFLSKNGLQESQFVQNTKKCDFYFQFQRKTYLHISKNNSRTTGGSIFYPVWATSTLVSRRAKTSFLSKNGLQESQFFQNTKNCDFYFQFQRKTYLHIFSSWHSWISMNISNFKNLNLTNSLVYQPEYFSRFFVALSHIEKLIKTK